MAEKIHSFYMRAEEIGGVRARAKLSMLTLIDSYQARSLPDSDDTIQLFESAMKQLVKEFNKGGADYSLRLNILKLLFTKKTV